EHLLKHADRLSHLKLLDLYHHYLTEEMQKKLQKTLTCTLELSEALTPEVYDDEIYMHAMYTE
ncbi:cytoplasmic protein, partial [Escherichia coli]